jgi:hypothetical protein
MARCLHCKRNLGYGKQVHSPWDCIDELLSRIDLLAAALAVDVTEWVPKVAGGRFALDFPEPSEDGQVGILIYPNDCLPLAYAVAESERETAN